jgi:hypothetical protein
MSVLVERGRGAFSLALRRERTFDALWNRESIAHSFALATAESDRS